MAIGFTGIIQVLSKISTSRNGLLHANFTLQKLSGHCKGGGVRGHPLGQTRTGPWRPEAGTPAGCGDCEGVRNLYMFNVEILGCQEERDSLVE